ncbi:hypothetical protein QP405_02830 [Gleimia europaea]|uniref:hypothetical protein n=1 Tax=Gleimia europaea TaxID=66228 RepID=UPI0026590677|nr:hypothetical protein [Gleimia europaea]MDK7142799.1 hypothetical protein [Gleimia europaea]
MADQVMNETNAEMVRAWRVAMSVGRFMAMRRQQALRKAEQSSIQHERALRRAIEDERLLAQKVYALALDDKWWQTAVQDDAAYVYGVARRFSDIDPQAELAARRCEREAKERWGIDVHAPLASASDIPSVDEALRDAPVLDGEDAAELKPAVQEVLYRAYQDGEYQMVGQDRAEAILDYVQEQKDTAPDWLNSLWQEDLSHWLDGDAHIAQRVRDIYPDIKAAEQMQAQAAGMAAHAQHEARVEGREGREARQELEVGDPSGVEEGVAVKEMSEAKHAGRGAEAAWDTMQARQAHAQSLLDQGADPQAVRAAMTADKGLHRPARMATRKSGKTNAPRARVPSKKAVRVQTRHM